MFYINCCRVLLESTSFAIMGQRLNNRFHLKNAMQKQKNQQLFREAMCPQSQTLALFVIDSMKTCWETDSIQFPKLFSI